MNAKEWIIIGAVVVVVGGASIASIFGAANMTGNALAGTQPHLQALYSPQTPEQQAVVDGVTGCMTHYSKVDPALLGVNDFDTTPLSAMSEERRTAAAQSIRVQLEAPCVAYGRFSAQRPGLEGPAVHLSVDQYMTAAEATGMDVAAANSWFDAKLAHRANR